MSSLSWNDDSLAVAIRSNADTLLDLSGLHLRRRNAQPITVAVEKDTLALTLRLSRRLDPLAPPGARPQRAQEADNAILGVAAVVLAHDGLDGLGGLVGVVEGDNGDVVVQDVRLDDAVEDVAPDEAELAVDGRGRATGEGPAVGVVVGERGVGVLEEGDGD